MFTLFVGFLLGMLTMDLMHVYKAGDFNRICETMKRKIANR